MQKTIDLGNSWITVTTEPERVVLKLEARDLLTVLVEINANDADKIIELGRLLVAAGETLNA